MPPQLRESDDRGKSVKMSEGGKMISPQSIASRHELTR